jgi:two-component system, OmpR family, alkaline phosphatase synthesis response regulator PhoP
MADKTKILIVEDEQALREILESKFAAAGFDVVTAENGEEGLKSALKEQPSLILLDVLMPVMDGLTMLEKLRQEDAGKKISVILLTNLSDVDTMAKALENKAYDYFVKTKWDVDELIGKVKIKLGKH